jgi:hypothetical protein
MDGHLIFSRGEAIAASPKRPSLKIGNFNIEESSVNR